MDNPPINILSLFTGIGGLDIGVEAALEYLGHRTRTLGVCERSGYPQACLMARMEEAAMDPCPIFGDLADIPGERLSGLVDLVIGGPPCQPVSCAGKQKGAADERYLWDETLELVEAIQPQVVFFENVPGLLSGGHAALIVSRLDAAGYVVAPPLRLRASDVGASHRRARVFIMAYREGGGFGVLRESPGSEGQPLCRGEGLAYRGGGRSQGELEARAT
ncbi:MAG: DNA cytosine methyltransferase, partial [candidate division Zixibacteria bacterium]|nr:DNA cytosine methyltransferase [candidate division Zixibacteria bacterium]